LRYNFAADSFYIMKLCSRLFVLYWKALVEFLLSVIELRFLPLTVEALQGIASVACVRLTGWPVLSSDAGLLVSVTSSAETTIVIRVALVLFCRAFELCRNVKRN